MHTQRWPSGLYTYGPHASEVGAGVPGCVGAGGVGVGLGLVDPDWVGFVVVESGEVGEDDLPVFEPELVPVLFCVLLPGFAPEGVGEFCDDGGEEEPDEELLLREESPSPALSLEGVGVFLLFNERKWTIVAQATAAATKTPIPSAIIMIILRDRRLFSSGGGFKNIPFGSMFIFPLKR